MTQLHYLSSAAFPAPHAQALPPQLTRGGRWPGPLARMALKAACLAPALVLAFALHALLG